MASFNEVKLKIKLQKIKTEVEYIKSIIPTLESELLKYINENNYKMKQSTMDSINTYDAKINDVPIEDIDKMIDMDELVIKSEGTKKLYKYLSLLIHPDKHVDEIEKYTESFSKLSVYYKENDYNSMLNLAKNLNIDVNDYDTINVDEQIKSLELYVADVKARLCYQWFFEENDEARKKLINTSFEKCN